MNTGPLRGRRVRLAAGIAAAALAWTGLLLDAGTSVPARMAAGAVAITAVASWLGHFTVLTNGIAALSLSASLPFWRGRPGRIPNRPELTGAIALSMGVVCAIYSLLLRHVWEPAGPQRVANVFLHYLGPLGYLAFWGLAVPRLDLRLRDLGWWLVYPVLYLAACLLCGSLGGTWVYFFLDTAHLGVGRVAVNCAWIGAGFVAFSLMMIGTDRLKPLP